MKFNLFIFIFILSPFVQAKTTLKFEELPNYLDQRNSNVKASRMQKSAAEQREGYFARSFIPSLEIYGKQESLKAEIGEAKSQKTVGADLKINLFNGGRDQLESEIRGLTSQSKQYQVQRVMAEELEQARILFWEILYTQKKIQLLESVALVNSQATKVAENRMKNGVATESDRFEFEIKAVELKRDLRDSQLNLSSFKRSLAILLGLEEDINIAVGEDLEHTHEVDQILKYNEKDQEYLFKELEIESKATELKAQSQKRVWWPKLDAYAGYAEYDPQTDFTMDRSVLTKNETMVGVQLTMALPQGFESIKESAALSNEARAAAELSRFQRKKIDSYMKNYFDQIKNLHLQVHDADSNVKRVEKYYKITQSEYHRGVKNSPDVLGASEKLFDIKLKRIQIVRDFQVLKIKLLSMMGK
jgi:outer membrane protein